MKPARSHVSAATLEEALAEACCQMGVQPIPAPLRADGRWHRAGLIDAPRGVMDASVKLFRDGQGGLLQNWKLGGEPLAFFVGGGHAPDPAEQKRRADRIVREMAKAERCEIHRRANAAARAAAVLAQVAPAQADHPYLKRKRVKPCEMLFEIQATTLTRVLQRPVRGRGGVELQGRVLVAPIYIDGEVSSLEFIDEGGTKSKLLDGAVSGGMWPTQAIAELLPEAGPVLLVEGVATALSVAEATGLPVAAVLSCGNFRAAIERLRRTHPEAQLVVGADRGGGFEAARHAALEAGLPWVAPDVDVARGETDFNDMAVAAGLDAVGQLIRVALSQTVSPEPCGDPPATAEDEPEKGRKSQATRLVEFATERFTLLCDANRRVYARDLATGEVWDLQSSRFRDGLVAQYYDNKGESARDGSLREALSTLSGIARVRGQRAEVSVRVAKVDDAYFLDLGEPARNRAIRLSAGGWTIVENHDVVFVRPETLRALPEPSRGGAINELWNGANIPLDAQVLVLAWVIECLRPDTPKPVLELIGEQGSAKSTTQAFLRRLIDPNASDLRTLPRSEEEMFIAAASNWLSSYENVSHLTPALQDAMCKVSTGAALAKRTLYTDSEETVIRALRPIAVNGISACVTAQDLIDRTVSIELPNLKERRSTGDIGSWFDGVHARLLGAMLDVAAQALAHLPDSWLAPEDRPRMIDFAYLGIAVERALGEPVGTFMHQYNEARSGSMARTIDANPVATAVMDWFELSGRKAVELPLKDLFSAVAFHKPSTDQWPRNPKQFGDALRRAAPALRSYDIEVASLGKIGGSVRWRIAPRVFAINRLAARPESPVVLPSGTPAQDFRTCRTSSPELSPVLEEEGEVF